jgi:ribosomal protein L7/L12
MTSLEQRLRNMFSQGATTEEMLTLMRQEGHSRINSISMLMTVTGISLAEAKSAVHTSEAWADLRQEADEFHAELEKVADQIANESRKA